MSYKDKRSGLLNTEKRIYQGVGSFDIPEILPIEADVTGLEAVGFNYMLGEKHPENKVLHFFLDDYQFERVWKEPDKYLSYLQKFRYVIAPDFSLYVDHPKAVQIFNHYRKHWCARYWQENGVNVIPCMCWSDQSSFQFCFSGEPKHSTVCVSSIGCFGNHMRTNNKEAFIKGWKEMHFQLDPSHVIIFGKKHKEMQTDCKVSVINNEQLKRKTMLSAKPTDKNSIQIPVTEMEVIEDDQV